MTARNNVISALETFLVAPSYSSDRYPVLLSCPIGYSLCQPLSISSPPRWSFIKKLRYSVVAPCSNQMKKATWQAKHGLSELLWRISISNMQRQYRSHVMYYEEQHQLSPPIR